MTIHFATRRFCQYAFQIIIAILGKIFLRPFTRVVLDDLRLSANRKQGYLIVSNHRGALDPFIICSVLPFRILLKLLPIGFMTHNVFYDSPLRPFCWISGCFPAKNPKGNHKIYGVDGSAILLEHGFSICIFPEGTRVRNAYHGEAHSGVVRIHKAAPTIPLLLCHIEYLSGLKNLLTGRRQIVKYKLVNNPDYNDPTKIMDDIFAL